MNSIRTEVLLDALRVLEEARPLLLAHMTDNACFRASMRCALAAGGLRGAIESAVPSVQLRDGRLTTTTTKGPAMPDYIIRTTITRGDEHDTTVRLVRAKNQAQALKHVVADTIKIEAATTEDAMSVAAAGGKLEIAAED